MSKPSPRARAARKANPGCLTLAGRSWDLPVLPFRLTVTIFPILADIFGDADAKGMRLTEARLRQLADAVYVAVNHVEPDLDRNAFDEMPFSAGELVGAFPALSRAIGLVEPASAKESSGRS